MVINCSSEKDAVKPYTLVSNRRLYVRPPPNTPAKNARPALSVSVKLKVAFVNFTSSILKLLQGKRFADNTEIWHTHFSTRHDICFLVG